MQSNTFQVGDRVQLIPFKHKGKTATVKYFGAIGRKFGTWVGLELDEPSGENSGDVNGEQLFECRPNHGLLLRNTQVKKIDEESVPARPRTTAIPKIDADLLGEEAKGSGGLGDSPLVTPRDGEQNETAANNSSTDGPKSSLMQAMTQAIQNPTAVRPKPTAAEDDTKKRGWQERLEKLKAKKQEEKAKAAADQEAKLLAPLTEEEKVRQSFTATSGIQRTTEGLSVAQSEVKKGPTGEQIFQEAVEETQKVAEQQKTTPQKSSMTTRSSLASLNKVIPKASPMKTGADEKKALGTTTRLGAPGAVGSRISRTSGQTAKQQELAAKKEEMERQRKLRQSQATGARTGVAASGRTSVAASGATSARGTTGRTSARPGGAPAATATTRQSLAQRTAAAALKQAEEKKDGPASRVGRPAMTSTAQTTGLKRPASRAGSNIRGASNTRSTIGASGTSPKRTIATTATGSRPAATSRLGTTARDRTPGPATGVVAAKATPMEIRKMENSIKDKEAEILRMTGQIKTLQNEKTILTKEKAEKEALAAKATKEKTEAASKVAKEKLDWEAKAVREKETIKKQFEAKLVAMQKEIKQTQEENESLQASQDANASLERSKLEEDFAMKVVRLESQVEEQNIQMEAHEKNLAEALQVASDYEQKLSEQTVQMAEKEQTLKDQEAKITENQTYLSEREQAHAARIADMEQQLKMSQEQIQESAVASTTANKEAYKKMEQQVASKFEETRATFEKSLLEAQAAAKKAQEEAKASKDKLDEEVQRRTDEAEIFELEKQTLEDEKKELMEKILETGRVEEVDPLKELGLEEIKLQNKKLRQAITALTFGFEEEKRKLEHQMKNETGKDKIIAEQEKRLEEMDFLLEEVERKEQERADMEEKLEEIVEYENMVEEMVQEIANREEENEELLEKITELEEENELMEELNQGLELDNTEMQEELAAKERELSAAKNEIDQLEGIVIDQDGITSKYKERQQELQKQIKVLSEQLAEIAQDASKDQVSVLLERQQQLIARLRDAEKKSLQITKSQIALQQERMRVDVVQNMLPESLTNEALLPCLAKVQRLNFVKHKAAMLVREICETQVDNASQVHADLSHLKLFYNTLLQLSFLSNRLVQSGHRICYFVANMSPGQYAEVTKLLAWDQLGAITEEIDDVLDLLKEENLAYNFELGVFEGHVKTVEQLQNTVEKAFCALTPEEQKAREELGPAAAEPETQVKRRAMAANCPKLSMRERVSLVAIAVMFVPRLATLYATELERRQVIQKVGLIYWRLLDVVLKLDNVQNQADGADFLSEEANNVDTRLLQKFSSIESLWQGSEAEQRDAAQKSWGSVLEAIERDVVALNNDFKFGQLGSRVEAKYGSGKIDFNDLYKVDFGAGGPWRTVTEQVRSELQDMGALKARNSQLMEKQKEQLKQLALMKKQKDEAGFIAQTLKGQLSQATAKADQVPALEIERTDLQSKISTMQNQLDSVAKETSQKSASIEDLKKKLDDAKKKADEAGKMAEESSMMMGPGPKGGLRRGNAIRQRQGPTKHMSRESGTAQFFRNLQNAGLANQEGQRSSASHTRGQSMANSAQMMQQIQMTEDIYTETINQLQADRMRLRGKDMFERLTKLQRQEGAFAFITNQMRDVEKKKEAESVNGVTVKLNKAEQLKVTEALESVETLKFKVKKQMATRRIVDLTKPAQPKAEEAKSETATQLHPVSETQNLNYMVMNTREKMNDAMQILFSRDSKLRKLQELTSNGPMKTSIPRPSASPKKSTVNKETASLTQGVLNQVRVGALRVRSKVKLPQNRVVLDESTLAELKRNVALFAT